MNEKLEPVSPVFKSAVEQHQDALRLFGEDDPRTIEAILKVMALAPDWLFAEMEEIANAKIH